MTANVQSTVAVAPKDAEVLRGSFRILFFYDVGEALDLGKLRQELGERGEVVEPIFSRRTPEYVRFEQAPVTEQAGTFTLRTGQQAVCSIRYYQFAGVVLQLILPFECDWNGGEITRAGAERLTAAELLSSRARAIDPRRIGTAGRPRIGGNPW